MEAGQDDRGPAVPHAGPLLPRQGASTSANSALMGAGEAGVEVEELVLEAACLCEEEGDGGGGAVAAPPMMKGVGKRPAPAVKGGGYNGRGDATGVLRFPSGRPAAIVGGKRDGRRPQNNKRHTPASRLREVLDRLRVGGHNINGSLLDKLSHLHAVALRRKLDVVMLYETQGSEMWEKLVVEALRELGGHYILYSRTRKGSDKSGPRMRGHGGVAMLVRVGLDVSLWATQRSAAAASDGSDNVTEEDILRLKVRLSDRGTERRWCYLVALYLSPNLSKEAGAARLAALRTDLGVLGPHHQVVVGGDFNGRIGDAQEDEGYSTVDVSGQDSGARHTEALLAFLGETGMAPAHGTGGRATVEWTNLTPPRAAGGLPGRSVVDYLVVNPPAMELVISAEQTVAGSHAADGLRSSHSFLFVDIPVHRSSQEPQNNKTTNMCSLLSFHQREQFALSTFDISRGSTIWKTV